jgi:hypothetical protein
MEEKKAQSVDSLAAPFIHRFSPPLSSLVMFENLSFEFKT